jgi:hypothetical protein
MSAPARLPETSKKPGVAYAVSEDGLELPVIDLTHPAFAAGLSEAELATAFAHHCRELKRRARWPRFLRTLLIRLLSRKSALLRSALGPGSNQGRPFMTGVATYLMKLGPDNLGAAWAKPLDRTLAAAYPPTGLRLRLRATAELLAEGLARALPARPAVPVVLLNIGGGPAMDSLNALLLLRRDHPDLLARRSVRIHVLDRDEAGPRFGARAAVALTAAGGALHGIDLSWTHQSYDWSSPASLQATLPRLGLADAVAAGSSEGALFDYGSDREISQNLSALRELTPPSFFVVGSVTRDDEMTRLTLKETGFAVRRLGIERFTALAGQAGWRLDRAIDFPLSHVARLVRD